MNGRPHGVVSIRTLPVEAAQRGRGQRPPPASRCRSPPSPPWWQAASESEPGLLTSWRRSGRSSCRQPLARYRRRHLSMRCWGRSVRSVGRVPPTSVSDDIALGHLRFRNWVHDGISQPSHTVPVRREIEHASTIVVAHASNSFCRPHRYKYERLGR